MNVDVSSFSVSFYFAFTSLSSGFRPFAVSQTGKTAESDREIPNISAFDSRLCSKKKKITSSLRN